jgi:hypothetical protein
MGRTSLEDAFRLPPFARKPALPRSPSRRALPRLTLAGAGPEVQGEDGVPRWFRVGWPRQPDGVDEVRRRPNGTGCRAFCASLLVVGAGRQRRRRWVGGFSCATCSTIESRTGGGGVVSRPDGTAWASGFAVRPSAADVCGCTSSGPELPGMDAGAGWLLGRCWDRSGLSKRSKGKPRAAGLASARPPPRDGAGGLAGLPCWCCQAPSGRWLVLPEPLCLWGGRRPHSLGKRGRRPWAMVRIRCRNLEAAGTGVEGAVCLFSTTRGELSRDSRTPL